MNNALQQYIIIVNPNCHQGKGWDKWLLIREKVMSSLPTYGFTFILSQEFRFVKDITPLLSIDKETIMISAGGDGGIHYLVNYIFGLPVAIRNTIYLGAIGLGSSNDFLKPFDSKIEGIPVKLNKNKKCVLSDVGLVRYVDKFDVTRTKYFIVNASLGVTAYANYNFNHPNKTLKFLKKYFTNAAIFYTAVSSILSYKNIDLKLFFNDQYIQSTITNVNILKIPYVSGSLHYTLPIMPDDGKLSVNICLNMNKWELLKVLFNLGRGIFLKNEKTISVAITNLDVTSINPFILECDGETVKTQKVTFSVINKAINILK